MTRKALRRSRVTVIIRARQKCSIKAIFVAFAVALRKQGCHLKTTNLIFTPSIFDALQFIVCRFGLNRGKNAVNPFGLTSILTKSKGKSAAINRGSDYFRYPIGRAAYPRLGIYMVLRLHRIRKAKRRRIV